MENPLPDWLSQDVASVTDGELRYVEGTLALPFGQFKDFGVLDLYSQKLYTIHWRLMEEVKARGSRLRKKDEEAFDDCISVVTRLFFSRVRRNHRCEGVSNLTLLRGWRVVDLFQAGPSIREVDLPRLRNDLDIRARSIVRNALKELGSPNPRKH